MKRDDPRVQTKEKNDKELQGYALETNNSTDSNFSSQQCQTPKNSSSQQCQMSLNIIAQQVQCSRCSKPLVNNDHQLQYCSQKQCIVKFHQQCFFKELNDQNTIKQVFLYKCKCGTKIPSKIIRKCGAPNLMAFLSSIHRRQLDLLITQSSLRKNDEIVSFYKQNKLKEHELDFFLQENDKLTYDETPQ